MFYERSCFIFDLDGTLIDSLGVWSQVDQELMRRLSNGRVMLSEDEAGTLRIRAMKTYGEGSDAYFKYMADLKRAFDLPGTPEEIHFQRYSLAQEFLRTRVHIAKGRQSSSNTSRHSARSSRSLPQHVGATLMFMPLRTNR